MLTQAFRTSLRILVFRAGPEDLPYDASGNLSRVALAFCLLCFGGLFALTMPALSAAVSSVLTAVSLWLVARLVLKSRNLQNREQQTVNALFLCNGLLGLLMIPVLARLAPTLLGMYAQLKAHPELINQPEQLTQPPLGPSLLFDLLGLWQLVICTRIYGTASGGSVLRGLGMTLLSMAAMFLLAMLVAPLIGLLAP